MKKIYKYGLTIIVIVFLGYNSIYFKKLSEVRAQEETAFDFSAFADSLYYQGMLKSSHAIDLGNLLQTIQNNSDDAFETYGNRLGIGNSAYFMVKTNGAIEEITDEYIRISTEDVGKIHINTQYIFGNALRDASGLVALTDFKTNAEFNKVSEALNAIIRKDVIPSVVEKLSIGNEITVTGALKLSKKNFDSPNLTITPAQIISQ